MLLLIIRLVSGDFHDDDGAFRGDAGDYEAIPVTQECRSQTQWRNASHPREQIEAGERAF